MTILEFPSLRHRIVLRHWIKATQGLPGTSPPIEQILTLYQFQFILPHPSTSFHILPPFGAFQSMEVPYKKKTPFIASIVHKPSVAPGRPEGSPEERRSLRGHRVQGLGRPISNPRHRRHHETSVVVTYKMYKEREEKHGKNG